MKFKKYFIFVMIFLLLFLVGCLNTPSNIQKKEDLGLFTVGSADKLKSLLKKSTNNSNYGPRIGGDFLSPSTEKATDDFNAGSSGSSDYTKTNVQVEGVDEGDVVKTDGRRIYTLNHDRLHVVGILENGMMEILLDEQIKASNQNTPSYYSNTYYRELYITDKYLVVIGQKYEYCTIKYDIDDKIDIEPYYYSRSANMSVITIYNIETLLKIETYEVSGSLLQSRLIGDNLYLLTNHYVYPYELEKDYDLRPWVSHNDETTAIDYNDIKYLPDIQYQSFTIITTVKLNDEIEFENDTFLGASSWGQVYVSLNAIYLATYMYEYTLLGFSKEKGKLISYQFDEDGTVSFGGHGEFSGHVINQFAMDEYDGYMRIVTTEGWGDSIKNRLYVFERKIEKDTYKLDVIGLIDQGLGKPRERVQSVRFNKDRATVVTFEQIDPFYTIDLSNPKKPTIKGELEVPGFSVYQHPWSDNLVIGIGFETGQFSGMKISLYDISDFDNPVEVGKPLLLSSNSNWSYSEALYNHKAILIDKNNNCLGFSLWRYNFSNSNYTSMNDYILFDVDETREYPIQIKHTVSHNDYYLNNSDLYSYWWYYDFTIKRAVRIDQFLYVISGEVITSHNLSGEFSTVDAIIFEMENPYIK